MPWMSRHASAAAGASLLLGRRALTAGLLPFAAMLHAPLRAGAAEEQPAAAPEVAVLCYHRFGATVADSMTVRTAGFEQQLLWLRDNGYRVIPLRTLVDHLRGEGPAPPPRSVVITADDGHRSVYSDMRPLVEKHDVPVTLFIYPSAISNASYALTWDQLREMAGTGRFDVQSHTYWHPNFDVERKRLSPEAFAAFTDGQLRRSKARLEQEMRSRIDLLAWPFGLIGPDLEEHAAQAGYVAAFSIVRRRAKRGDDMLSIPRFLMTDRDGVNGLRAILGAGAAGPVADAGGTRQQAAGR